MGPNSQRKKSAPVLNTPTRARFSNWKPPNKHKSGRGRGRGHDDRDEKRGNQTPISILDIKSKISIDKDNLDNQLPNGLVLSRLENLEVDSIILNILFSELNKTKNDLEISDKRLLQIINEPITKPLEIKIKSLSKSIIIANPQEIKNKPVSLQPISFGKITNKSIDFTPAQKKVQNSYLQIGFTIKEITSAFHLIDTSDIDEDEIYLSLLLVTSKQDYNINKKNSNLISDHEKADCNQELKEEAEVLQSIYEDDILIRKISLLQVVCSVIDLNINIGNNNSSIRIIIYNSPEYPNIKSKVLIWLFISKQFKSDDQFCRDISCEAMKESEILMKNKVAFVFDIIQFIQSSVTAKLESIVDVVVDKPIVKNINNVNNNKNKIDKNNKNITNDETTQIDKNIKNKTIKTPIKEPTLVIDYLEQKHIKEEKLTDSTEYRQAINRALNDGLLGQQARDSARKNLEYVFSSDKIARIKNEEDKIEAIRNKSFSFNKLGTGGEIEALKLLSQQTSLSKVRSKSLLRMSKSSMIDEGNFFLNIIYYSFYNYLYYFINKKGRIYARDEASMINNWVKEAKDVYIKRLEAAEVKSKENKDKRKQSRGLTIRDARKQRDASLIEEDEEEEEEEEYDEECGEDGDGNKDNEFEICSGPFTAAHCTALATMKMNAKSRANGNSGEDLSKDELKKVQIEKLASRRLLNELEEKKKSPKYQDMLDKRSSLPACQMSKQIVGTIKKNRVVVICGATGCGKTTQIPQLVFDDAINEGIGGQMNMIITQPRRISAISVAERIAEERIEKVGQTAGFHIRLESKRSMKTRLLLVTTGVLLRRLQLEEDLEGVSHIFVDEVHERDIQTDFLLIVLKTLMKRRPQLKVVCMSATLNAKMFADYFNEEGCSLISIPGRAFPVTSFFLEDAIQQIGFKINSQSDCIYKTSMAARNDPKIKDLEIAKRDKRWKSIQSKLKANCSADTMNCLEIIDESMLNTQLIIQLIVHISLHCAEGAMLIFVSGIADIRNLIDEMRVCRELNDLPTKIFPLHSSLSSQEQSKVFQIYSKGVRKIVVTTNIAETSITIPDVVYVIDSGRVKENRFDEKTQLSILEETWISKANAQQRKGRAGRVTSGICYNLASSVTFDSFSDYTEPEMLRLSLEDIILQVLALDLGDPYDFLASAISPPERKSIKNSLLYLDNLNAVNIEENARKPQSIGGGSNDTSYNSVITPLGYHLASLPLSPRIGKLIIYGLVLGCINPILSIAAIVSSKSPFIMPFEPSEREQADQAKERFLEGNSDLLTMLNAYKDWKKVTKIYLIIYLIIYDYYYN
jgi:ATP-dependent RNA helicase DHX36